MNPTTHFAIVEADKDSKTYRNYAAALQAAERELGKLPARADFNVFIVATPEGRFFPCFHARNPAATQYAFYLASRRFYTFN